MCYAPHLRDRPPDWCEATVTSLREVEDMLDLLENRGCVEMTLTVLGDCLFAVRWR